MDRRQRKLEKKRTKRNLAKKAARAKAAARPSDLERWQRLAERSPFGPCFVSSGWDDADGTPELVEVVVTRRLPDGSLLPCTVLVDRTCLGIKNALVAPPGTEAELQELLESLGMERGSMDPCEPLVAQSIVFHAIDYARSLGFEPQRDFRETLFGPRPQKLLDTAWRAPERPYYVGGPYDDVKRVLARLTAAVGADHFDFVEGGLTGLNFEVDVTDDGLFDPALFEEGLGETGASDQAEDGGN